MKRRRIALFGDWNAEVLRDTGRYSAVWIAQQTGLRRVHAGPGRHGNIDYALTDAAVSSVHRLGNGQLDTIAGNARGSDHDALLYVIGAGDQQLRVLQWNLQRDRPVRVVLDQLEALIKSSRPDVIVLQEAADYASRIGAQLHDHFVMVTGDEHENRQNVLLVFRGHVATGKRVVQLSHSGWTTAEGFEHGPIFGPSVVIDGWLRVVGVHMPPSVNWRKGTGLPYGPIRRVAVYVSAARKLVRWIRHWKASE